VGVVERGPSQWVGKRIVGSINLGCGECNVCLSTGPEHCPDRTVLGIINHNGAFADYLTLPLTNLIEVPENLSDERAVFTEPLAAALRIREQIVVSPSARIAVIGPGRLGLLVGLTLNQVGTDLQMIGRSATSLILPRQMGLQVRLPEEVEADSYDVVVEATGNRSGLIQALHIVKPLGMIVMKSTYAALSDIDLTKIVVGEIKIVGSRCGPFPPALRLLASDRIDVSALVDAEYALEDGLEAMAHAARPGTRKILLRP
jgi:threonine dehydrogenase-like Zn-dependent dehydrogenase